MGRRAHSLALGIGFLGTLPAWRVISVGEGRYALLEPAGAIGPDAVATIGIRHRRHLDMGFRQFVDEARRQARLPQIAHTPVLGEGDGGPALGAGDADISETAFLLEAGAAVFIEGALMREEAFLPAGKEDRPEFKTLGRVNRGENQEVVVDEPRPIVSAVGIVTTVEVDGDAASVRVGPAASRPAPHDRRARTGTSSGLPSTT